MEEDGGGRRRDEEYVSQKRHPLTGGSRFSLLSLLSLLRLRYP